MYYKVCFKDDDGHTRSVGSCINGLVYSLNNKTVPEYPSKLFVFSSLEYAMDYKGSNYHIIFECEVENPVKPPLYIPRYPIKEYWMRVNAGLHLSSEASGIYGATEFFVESMKPPVGTVLVDSVTPVKIVYEN